MFMKTKCVSFYSWQQALNMGWKKKRVWGRGTIKGNPTPLLRAGESYQWVLNSLNKTSIYWIEQIISIVKAEKGDTEEYK